MALTEIDLINFVDAGSQGEGFALIKAGDGIVGLTLSLEEDGDMEVYLLTRHCAKLIASLQKALEVANIH